MSLIRPLTRGLIQPITRPLLGRSLGGDALTPAVKALFASGEKGVMFDFTKASNLYTDSARTTLVTASGDLVGSATDLSPNGKHASSAGSARPSWNSAGYATFDAFDDYLQTAAIDFSGTANVTLVASVRKLSDAGAGIIAETSIAVAGNSGSLGLYAADGASNYSAACRGSGTISSRKYATYTAPISNVITVSFTTVAASSAEAVIARINGADVAGTSSSSSASTGNFASYPLNIGARNAASLFFNGRLYRLLVIGRSLTTTERNTAERWAAQPVGIAIP